MIIENFEEETLENKLRKLIMSGEYPPGSKLTQEHLAKQLNVSRMPIREALFKLEIEGLVIFESNRGAFVRDISIDMIEENYQLRSELEKLALLKSYPYLTNEDIEDMKQLLKRMENTENTKEFVENNVEFHRLLLHKCPWPRLKSFVQALWNGYPQQTPNFLKDQIENSNKDHTKIVFAIESDCPEVAAEILSEHISNTGKKLIDYMKN